MLRPAMHLRYRPDFAWCHAVLGSTRRYGPGWSARMNVGLHHVLIPIASAGSGSVGSSQRAMTAAQLLDYKREQARKRMQEGGGNRKSSKESVPDLIADCGQARDKAVKRVGVSGKSSAGAAKGLEKDLRPDAPGLHCPTRSELPLLGPGKRCRVAAVRRNLPSVHIPHHPHDALSLRHGSVFRVGRIRPTDNVHVAFGCPISIGLESDFF